MTQKRVDFYKLFQTSYFFILLLYILFVDLIFNFGLVSTNCAYTLTVYDQADKVIADQYYQWDIGSQPPQDSPVNVRITPDFSPGITSEMQLKAQ